MSLSIKGSRHQKPKSLKVKTQRSLLLIFLMRFQSDISSARCPTEKKANDLETTCLAGLYNWLLEKSRQNKAPGSQDIKEVGPDMEGRKEKLYCPKMEKRTWASQWEWTPSVSTGDFCQQLSRDQPLTSSEFTINEATSFIIISQVWQTNTWLLLGS